MTERPILMKPDMAQAAFLGLKGLTQRVMTPQPELWWPDENPAHEIYLYKGGKFALNRYADSSTILDHCPYGKVGDRLWIRETHDIVPKTAYWHDSTIPHQVSPDGESWAIYRGGWERVWEHSRPSLFMPRWACRTVVEITGIEARRVLTITEEESIAEGIQFFGPVGEWTSGFSWSATAPRYQSARSAYAGLWDFINAKPKPVYEGKEIISYVSYPWAPIQEERVHRGKPWLVIGNPWCWSVGFRKVEAEGC